VAFCNLHVHSNYSYLDGLSKIEDIVSRVKEMGQQAVACSDHGSISGLPHFYKTCRKEGIKPILACELYFTRDANERVSKKKGVKRRDFNSHLLAIAKTTQGYKNLVKLTSESYDNFYFNPRVTLEMLDKYRDGLIICTACLASPFAKHFMGNELDKPWKSSVEGILEIFKDNLFFETQPYDSDEQREYNRIIRQEAVRRNIPVITSTDSHYTRREDYKVHEVLLAIQSGSSIHNKDRMGHDSPTLYLHSEEELLELGFPPEELNNTVHLAKMCNAEIDFSTKFPKVQNAKKIILKSCETRMKELGFEGNEVYEDRLKHELKTIEKCGFEDYFVILADILNFAKEKGIRTGYGRGSAAASLVCMLMGITKIDPIKHDLLFARFLHEDRIGNPDIDTDISDERREEVVNYIIEKYGRENVANISTIGRLGVKAAFKDIARAYEIPFGISNDLSGSIPYDCKSIRELYNTDEFWKQKYDGYALSLEILELTDSLKGSPRQPGTHAAGFVIAPGPITDYVPLMKIKDEIVTAYDMQAIEDCGLVKFDILGLKTLTIVEKSIDLINKDLENEFVKLNDPQVFKMIRDGWTLGCFQIETQGITALCKQIKVSNFEDICHVISLYRPGVLGTEMMHLYLKNRETPGKIEYIHDSISKYLEKTYGILLYNEQKMKMSMDIAGFSGSKADELRKGIAKKKPEIIMGLKNQFISGAINRDYSKKDAERIFKILEDGGYDFNEAHAVSYGCLSYVTAYLKTYYPLEFMTCVINSESDEEKLGQYFFECKRLGIQILPFDINKSYEYCTIENRMIRLGINLAKGIGESASSFIIKERKEGGFTSVENFIKRVNLTKVNSKVIKVLVMLGFFDSLNWNRRELTQTEKGSDKLILEAYLDMEKKASRLRKGTKNQPSLFNLEALEYKEMDLRRLKDLGENEKIKIEKENLGYFINDPLFDIYNSSNGKFKNIEDGEENPQAVLSYAGIIESFKVFPMFDRKTKKQSEGCGFTLRTIDSKLRCIIFTSDFHRSRMCIQNGQIVKVDGKYNFYKGEKGIIALNVERLD